MVDTNSELLVNRTSLKSITSQPIENTGVNDLSHEFREVMGDSISLNDANFSPSQGQDVAESSQPDLETELDPVTPDILKQSLDIAVRSEGSVEEVRLEQVVAIGETLKEVSDTLSKLKSGLDGLSEHTFLRPYSFSFDQASDTDNLSIAQLPDEIEADEVEDVTDEIFATTQIVDLKSEPVEITDLNLAQNPSHQQNTADATQLSSEQTQPDLASLDQSQLMTLRDKLNELLQSVEAFDASFQGENIPSQQLNENYLKLEKQAIELADLMEIPEDSIESSELAGLVNSLQDALASLKAPAKNTITPSTSESSNQALFMSKTAVRGDSASQLRGVDVAQADPDPTPSQPLQQIIPGKSEQVHQAVDMARSFQNPNALSGQQVIITQQIAQNDASEVSEANLISEIDDASVVSPSHSQAVTQRASAEHTVNHTLKMTQTLGDTQWREAFAEKVAWLSNQTVKQATLTIRPPEFGSIEISIKMHESQAQIHFNTQHSATTDALTQAMPRLRDMFEAQGLQLTDANVSEQGSGQGQSQHEQQNAPHNSPQDETEPHISRVSSKSLIDYYA